MTNVCCEATVRDASTLGYRVVLVADACGAHNDSSAIYGVIHAGGSQTNRCQKRRSRR